MTVQFKFSTFGVSNAGLLDFRFSSLSSLFRFDVYRCSALSPRDAPTMRTPNSPINGNGLPVFGSCVGAGSGAAGAGAGAGRAAATGTGTGTGTSISNTRVGGGVAGLGAAAAAGAGAGAGAVPVTARVTL